MESNLNIPEGYQGVMPYLIIQDSEAFLEFLKKVFDAKEKKKVMNQEGTNIVHAEAIIFGRCIMFGSSEKASDEPSGLSIFVPNVARTYTKALEAGATSIQEPISPLFTGGRFAVFQDRFGNSWWIFEGQKTDFEKKQPALTPYFAPKESGAFFEFLKKVFNAEEQSKIHLPSSENIEYAEALVAGNTIIVSTGSDEDGYFSGGLTVSVPATDVDEIYKKARAEGATSIMEPTEFPWGKFSGWKDPFGNTWWVVSQQPGATENVNPYVSPKDCGAFIEFMKKVFDAEEKIKNLTPEGAVSFCDLRVLGTVLQCCEGSEEKGYITGAISVCVQNVDEIDHKARSAGATPVSEPNDSPSGRSCTFKDSFGNFWIINEDEEVSGLEQEVQVPKEDHGLCPYLILKGAAEFGEFLKKVFHAEEITKSLMGDVKTIVHAQFKVSGSIIKCSEGSQQFGYRNGGIFVYVSDADETHKVALSEGATEVMPPSDQTYGRSSGVKDPFGNTFWITSTPKNIGA